MNARASLLLGLVLLAALAASPAHAATNAPINIGAATEPVAMAVNPATGRVYVLDLKVPSGFITYGYVYVYDGATRIRTLVSGQFSKGMAFDGYHNKIYVSNSLDNNLTILDTNTDQWAKDANNNQKTITLFDDPAAIAFSYYSAKFYVTYRDRSRPGPAIAVINPADDSILGRIYDFDQDLTGVAWPVHGTAAHNMLALGGGAPAKVYTIETFNHTIVRTTLVGNSPGSPFPVMYRPMASQNSHAYSYVANSDSSTVTMLNGDGSYHATINVPAGPVAISGEDHWVTGGGHVFVACRDANQVVEISEHTVTRVWGGFNHPTALQYNPTTQRLYVGDAGRIWMIHL